MTEKRRVLIAEAGETAVNIELTRSRRARKHDITKPTLKSEIPSPLRK